MMVFAKRWTNGFFPISSIEWVTKKKRKKEKNDGEIWRVKRSAGRSLVVSILHRLGRHWDFTNAFLIRQATHARAEVRGWHDQRREGKFGRPGDNARKGGKGGRGLSLIRSPGANDANLPYKSRHISRHRAVEGRSCEPTLWHPFSPVRSSLSLPRTILWIRWRWMKSFPSCYPGSYHAARRRVENSTM